MDYRSLTAENEYTFKPAKAKKKGLFNTVKFYLRIGKVIFTSSKLGRTGRYDGNAWCESSFGMLDAARKAGANIEIDGIDNIRLDEPVVYISNHMSTLETFIMPCIIYPNNKVCFIMKKELVDMPFFGSVSGSRHPIIVGRKNPREDLMEVFKQSKNRIDEGRSIIVFPQRSRSDKLNEKEFNTIGVKIAKKYNVKIVPVAVTTDFWENGKIVKDFGSVDPSKKVRMSFGKPFEPSGDGNKDNRTVFDFIESKFIEWGFTDRIVKK
ncbi:MAG: lysophospholipid acyltransferase family protein [Rhodothermaceae bacterium]